MTATPIIAGRAYEVSYGDITLTVLAENGCDAICIAIGILLEQLRCAA